MECFVDRIEGKTAVILVKGGGRMEIPVSKFPFKLSEGLFLRADFRKNPAERKKVKNNIKALQKKLLKRSASKKK